MPLSGRFGLKHILCRTFQMPGFKGLIEIVPIDNPSTGAVNQHGAPLHPGKGIFIDEVGGFVVSWRMNGDMVGSLTTTFISPSP
jgi:hypothetical protein